jgi:glycosyltransferase involved in cell wall biosynthesis
MLVAELIRRKSRLLKTAWINLFDRRNLAEAAAVHVTSEIEAEALRQLGIAVRRIAIVPNGIDCLPAGAIPNPTNTARAGSVLCLGRINWKKGLDRLIAAIALVPQATLTIAGNDEEEHRRQLERTARWHGVADRVRFVGPVHGDAKWNLIASADVFALASHSESFGNAALEAMACGVPVVVTPEVGLAPTVAAADAGLVAVGESMALAAAIRGLLADADTRRRMGDNGRRVVSERFSWGTVAAMMEEAYRQATAGAGESAVTVTSR